MNTPRLIPILTAMWFSVALTTSANAQATLTGRVSNAATGRSLAGATVEVAGRPAAVTDDTGSYRLDDLPAGLVKLTVSYTGLKAQEITLDLSGPGARTRDIELTADIYRLDTLVVSGEREGSALAITMQRQSTGVKNVVSTDAFGSLGANPADLLQRLPGVFGENDGSGIRYIQVRGMGNQLNSITMDGNRMADAASAGATREFQFTQVNADTIERIEVIKSPTPDMDADSIGGAVNMVSKSAFDRSHRRTLSGQAGIIMRTRYDIDDPRPAFSLSYSEVFGGRVGVSLNYGWRRHLSAIPATSRNYENKLADPAYTYQFGTEDYHLLQTRQGGGLKLDYKLSPSTRFYVNLTGNTMYEPNFSHFSTFTTAQTIATRDAAGNLTGTGTIIPGYTKDVTEWRPLAASLLTVASNSTFKEVKARHAEIGAVHRWRNLDLDYNLYRSRSQTNYPHQENVTLTLRGLGLRIENTADPFRPRLTQLSGPDITNIGSYLENAYDLRVARGIDAYKGLALNSRYRFTAPVPALIKAGFRFREQTRDLFDDRFRWQYLGPDGVMGNNAATGRNDDNLARWLNPSITRWSGLQNYARLPWLHYPNSQKWDKPYDASGPDIASELAANPSHFTEDVALRTMTRLNNLQFFKERISAAYLQAGVDLGPLTILGGVRIERTETEGDGAKNEVTPAEAARRAAFVGALTPAEIIRRNEAQYGGRLRVNGEYQQAFPGVHVKYTPIRDLLARASYSTNIGRPSIGQ
ncbi:MAG: TonB-dependent receptor plug domain-containing protein, partial [Opitutaceae bacterium]|nr:TonB-dependent receptor plug domain-containing protein [Opitutaceae bacterium]